MSTPDPDPDPPSRNWYSENSWILTPLLVFVGIAMICVGVHLFRTRRRRSPPPLTDSEVEAGFVPPHGSLVAQIEQPPATRRDRVQSYREWRMTIDAETPPPTTSRRPAGYFHRPHNPDEGLDEFGEAPPPYEGKKKRVLRPEAVEMARMQAEMEAIEGLPPAYGQREEGMPPEYGEGVTSPERVAQRED